MEHEASIPYLSAALAEFKLRLSSFQYLGRVNSVWDETVLLVAQSEESANGVCGWILFLVQATGALLGRQTALPNQSGCQKLEVYKSLKATLRYR